MVASSILTIGNVLCGVLEQETYRLLTTGSTQEDQSRHDWKINWDVKHQNKTKHILSHMRWLQSAKTLTIIINYYFGSPSGFTDIKKPNVFMPPKELWEAYSNRTVRPSVRPSCFRVRSISPIFFEVGIPNLVCGCIFGWRSVAYHFLDHCDLDLDLT